MATLYLAPSTGGAANDTAVSTANPLPVAVVSGGAGGGTSTPTGTAGAPNASVVTVQGITGATALIVSVQPASVSAMSAASVTTISAQVLAARAGRRRLSVQNTGAGAVTLLFGTGTATVGAGIILASGGSAGSQGGAWEEPAQECWAGAIQAIGASASTLTIIEG